MMLTEELFNEFKNTGLFQGMKWSVADKIGQLGTSISGENAYFSLDNMRFVRIKVIYYRTIEKRGSASSNSLKWTIN